MIEITLSGNNYRISKLVAKDQGHLARRLAPLVPKAIPAIREFYKLHLEANASAADGAGPAQIPLDKVLEALGSTSPLAEALADLKDETFDQIVALCMSVTTRQQGNSWAKVMQGNTMMFSDIEFDTLLPLMVQAVRENLGNFIAGLVSQGLAAQSPAPQ